MFLSDKCFNKHFSSFFNYLIGIFFKFVEILDATASENINLEKIHLKTIKLFVKKIFILRINKKKRKKI